MVTLISNSTAETENIGAQWAMEARAGWLIGLSGDLGAGKTQLVRGLARGLASPQRVHSPTFALLNEYSGGQLPLHHLDLYRLNSPDEIVSAGLESFLTQPPGVAVVEWIERWLPLENFREQLKISGVKGPLRLAQLEWLDENRRRITYEDFGH
jgi:tRNA threonylcarbamoyladenosine biosynthesis protein TsaE